MIQNKRFNDVDAAVDKIQACTHITEAGKAWLKASMDPFHDGRISGLEGYPDQCSENSVVQTVTQSVTISTPMGGTSTPNANWDCNMVMWPWDIAVNPPNSASTGGGVAWDAGAQGNLNFMVLGAPKYAVGGFSWGAAPTGATTYPLTSAYNASLGYISGTLDLENSSNADYSTAAYRVIGAAFEVVNTTAELYKQGQAAVFRSPTNTAFGDQYNLNFSTGGTTSAPSAPAWTGPTDIVQLFPDSLADVMILPSSQQWDAAKGCYCVQPFNSFENPARMASQQMYLALFGDGLAPNDDTTSTAIGNQMIVQTVNSHQFAGPWATHRGPFDFAGCYFSGLSAQTSLTVNVRWIIETFPSPYSTLAVLASPSPAYDPVAFQLASIASRTLPVGCPYDENPLGEWFEEVASRLLAAADPILGAATAVMPELAPLVPFLRYGAKYGEGVLKQRIKNRPKKKPGLKNKADKLRQSVDRNTRKLENMAVSKSTRR